MNFFSSISDLECLIPCNVHNHHIIFHCDNICSFWSIPKSSSVLVHSPIGPRCTSKSSRLSLLWSYLNFLQMHTLLILCLSVLSFIHLLILFKLHSFFGCVLCRKASFWTKKHGWSSNGLIKYLHQIYGFYVVTDCSKRNSQLTTIL